MGDLLGFREAGVDGTDGLWLRPAFVHGDTVVLGVTLARSRSRPGEVSLGADGGGLATISKHLRLEGLSFRLGVRSGRGDQLSLERWLEVDEVVL